MSFIKQEKPNFYKFGKLLCASTKSLFQNWNSMKTEKKLKSSYIWALERDIKKRLSKIQLKPEPLSRKTFLMFQLKLILSFPCGPTIQLMDCQSRNFFWVRYGMYCLPIKLFLSHCKMAKTSRPKDKATHISLLSPYKGWVCQALKHNFDGLIFLKCDKITEISYRSQVLWRLLTILHFQFMWSVEKGYSYEELQKYKIYGIVDL